MNSTPPPFDTSAWRILHDARREIWVDNFDGRWLAQTANKSLPSEIVTLAKRENADALYWRPRDAETSTRPIQEWGNEVTEPFSIQENGARFKIDFSAGYSPGIFLDQRENRKRVRDWVDSGDTVLNAFAYTGAFSVMAALGGATTTTLDLSKTYLDWAWENFSLNDLDREKHFGCKGDAFEWLATFARQGRAFDGVILDPPTFSRHGKKTFRTDRDYSELAKLATKVTPPGGWMLCCANTHRMAIREFEKEVVAGIRSAGRNVSRIVSYPMPPEFEGDDYLKSLRVDVG